MMCIGFLPCVEPWRLKDKVVVPVIIDYHILTTFSPVILGFL